MINELPSNPTNLSPTPIPPHPKIPENTRLAPTILIRTIPYPPADQASTNRFDRIFNGSTIARDTLSS
jgi:hypothetical protein